MLSSLFKLVKGALPSVGGLAPWLYGAAALAIATFSAWATHQIDRATLETLKTSYAQAETKAVKDAMDIQKATDQVALHAAVAEAKAQQQIIVRNVTTVKEVTKYVSDRSNCITYGLVRLLDATALGVDPASLPLPAGKSNDTCAPVGAAALAASVGANFGASLANAEQLGQLQDYVRNVIAAQRGR